MPLLIENLITAVLWLIGVGLVLTFALVLVTLQRRLVRQRYFRELDKIRRQARRDILDLYGRPNRTEEDIDAAVAHFRAYRSKVRRKALEDALLREAARANFELTRTLVVRLGWIDDWIDVVRSHARRPTGELARTLDLLGDDYKPARRILQRHRAMNFLERAAAAEKLGAIPTREGLLALLAGTRDPHRDVEQLCVRSLGRLAEPVALGVLIENTVMVLEGESRQSIRTLEMALLQYRVEDLAGFLPALDYPNPRVRFFACDVVRRICEREAASRPAALGAIDRQVVSRFVDGLWRDESADVRARAALVIGQIRDAASPEILKTLLVDPVWYVRLHASRAACDRFYLTISHVLAQRITDEHWLVREAAVHSLRRMEGFGVEQILNLFLATQDRYAAEQIADEIQRHGVLTEILARAEDPKSTQWLAAVARRMVGLGKTSLLLGHLGETWPTPAKVALLRELATSTSPPVLEALERCAVEDPDPTIRAEALHALEAVRERTASPAAAASGRRSLARFQGPSGRRPISRFFGESGRFSLPRILGSGSRKPRRDEASNPGVDDPSGKSRS